MTQRNSNLPNNLSEPFLLTKAFQTNQNLVRLVTYDGIRDEERSNNQNPLLGNRRFVMHRENGIDPFTKQFLDRLACFEFDNLQLVLHSGVKIP